MQTSLSAITPRTFHILAFDAPAALATNWELRSGLLAVVRDFQPYGSNNLGGLDAHPDFNNCTASEKGIVATTLGADSKPVYAKTSEPSLCCMRHFLLSRMLRVPPLVLTPRQQCVINAKRCCRLECHRVMRQRDHTWADMVQSVVPSGA